MTRVCPFCGGKLQPELVAGVRAELCHALRCLGYDQSVPTVLVWQAGALVRRRDLERHLDRALAREHKIEQS